MLVPIHNEIKNMSTTVLRFIRDDDFSVVWFFRFTKSFIFHGIIGTVIVHQLQ